MFKLVLFPLPLHQHVLLLALVGDVVAQTHPNGIADGGSDCDCDEVGVGEVDGGGAKDDGEDVDGGVEAAVDEGFEEVPQLDMLL